jgi:hypothetical protein
MCKYSLRVAFQLGKGISQKKVSKFDGLMK